MHADVFPSHDISYLFLRWEIVPESGEKIRLNSLGGPLWLEIETSCYVDTAGNRLATQKVKIPIWPYPGPKNIGQARFYDVDARRRFWVNLQDAVGKAVVDYVFDVKPGSVPKEGVTIRVAERPAPSTRSGSTDPSSAPAAAIS